MRRIAALSLVLAGLLPGCAGPARIDTETAPSADFSQRRTFAWQESQASYDPEPDRSARKAHDAEKVKAAIHEAVVVQLAQKGYSEAAGNAPDFLVSFHLVVSRAEPPDLCMRRQAIFEWPSSTAQTEMYEICRVDPVLNRRTLHKGTLVVFVVDAATRALLWQGVADDDVTSRNDQIQKLRLAVERMFATFPVESA